MQVALLGALVVAGLLIWRFASSSWLLIPLIPLVLVGYHYYNRLSKVLRQAYVVLLVIIACLYGNQLFQTTRNSVETPPRWDFHLFWTFGRASAAGLDVYDHDTLLNIITPLDPPPILIKELYFFHEPPTLFLFAPLGWFSDIRAAALFWYAVNTLILVVVIVALWKIYSDTGSYFDLLFITSLVLSFYPTLENVLYAQLNYLLLLFLLLFWQSWNKPIGALWLVLGIFTKPILLFYLGFLALLRAWRQILVVIGVMATVSIVTMLVYGPDAFIRYLSNNPIVNKMPLTLYTEIGNQSLLAAILRLLHDDLTSGSPLLNPIFLVATAVITLISVVIILRLGEKHVKLGLALFLALSLLIFPKTLTHYSFLLLPLLFLLWKQRSQVFGQPFTVIAFIAFVYFVVTFQSGEYTFFAYAASWLALTAYSIWILMHPQLEPLASADVQLSASSAG